MLESAQQLLDGLVVYKDKMIKNLQLTNGLILTEAVMMDLAPILGKQKAHDLLHSLFNKATKESLTLRECLMEEPLVLNSISSKRLGELLNPQNYLGAIDTIIDQAVYTRLAN